MTKMPENVFFTSGDGKALAPIFGKKKPRQALLAHPNNSQTRPAPTASYGGIYIILLHFRVKSISFTNKLYNVIVLSFFMFFNPVIIDILLQFVFISSR